jgi:RNA recognition motif-containing protein
MGKYMEREVASYLNSPDYKTLATDTIKKWMLRDKINNFRTKARNRVLNVEDNLTDAERNRRFKANFNAIGAENQKLTRDVYKNLYGGEDLLEELKTNDDLYSMAMGLYEAHVKRKPY